jgi:hypothetical protein
VNRCRGNLNFFEGYPMPTKRVRPRLGRPPLPEGTAMIWTGFRVRPDQMEFLKKSFTRENRSKFLRDLVDAAMSKKKS